MAQSGRTASSTGSPQEPKPPKIDRKSLIQDALDRHPELAEKVFAEMDLPCIDCPAAEVETLEFGFCLLEQPDDKLSELLRRLNELPPPPPEEEEDEGRRGPITAFVEWLARRRQGDAGKDKEGAG